MAQSLVFYRKWRPQRLAEVVGQEAIVQTLRNALATGRVGGPAAGASSLPAAGRRGAPPSAPAVSETKRLGQLVRRPA